MASVLGYARTYFVGGSYRPEALPDLAREVERFHTVLTDLAGHLERREPLLGITPEQLLQGPFADAMTHAGQLGLLRGSREHLCLQRTSLWPAFTRIASDPNSRRR